jgi:myosin heavy subunit
MPPAIARLKPMTFCEAVLVALDLNGGKDFQMGLTKVFFRAGKLQFLDDLTSNSQATINGIVGKVKSWLARKRFKAAIFGVVSLGRLFQRVQRIRKVHVVRRVARDMVSFSKVWSPLVIKARQNILTSEEFQKRQAEEEKRKEEVTIILFIRLTRLHWRSMSTL